MSVAMTRQMPSFCIPLVESTEENLCFSQKQGLVSVTLLMREALALTMGRPGWIFPE